MKRKEPELEDSEDQNYKDESEDSDGAVDILNSLVFRPGKRLKTISTSRKDREGDEDGDDTELINAMRMKSNVKEGMGVLKRVKGKGKLAKGTAGGGSFQSMGLHPSLLRSLLLRGYRTPTPIQRLAIPTLLTSPPRDLVGMARTGSGKTLAYMVPLLHRLGGRHGTTFGTRALILVPARELALQIMKVGKELARGWSESGGSHAGDTRADDEPEASKGKGQALRWGLIVGGESLDEQFAMISNNPDVIIATPGRLLHLIVEMNLDLRSVQYVVFDEADRLFEMGFATALEEILHRLPTLRQTLLFSATLPKNLVEFAKAGLQNPTLVRLDAESKISTDLRMAFFSVKQAEKDACLLTLLRDTIHVPFASEREQERKQEELKSKKHKSKEGEVLLAPHQTLIFAATKHHVEYLTTLLTTAGYAVSHIYGSLDQGARTLQMDRFRRNITDLLVVTDVAARGIDIPILQNVVNYDFPQGARVFVHRVGRTARAGRSGWAWSFINNAELPHLIDLQMFLGKEMKTTVGAGQGESAFTESIVLGTFPRDRLDEEVEYVKTLDDTNSSLPVLREVMRKGQGLYERTMGKANQPSYKRAKEMVKEGIWGLAGSAEEGTRVHPAISFKAREAGGGSMALDDAERKRQEMLKAVNLFKPSETVFEIGNRGKAPAAVLMKDRRKTLSKAISRAPQIAHPIATVGNEAEDDTTVAQMEKLEMADEDEVEAVFHTGRTSKAKSQAGFRDSEFYMSHYQKDAIAEKGYSLKDGASFIEQARSATFDLTGDNGGMTGRQRHGKQLNWDKKKKKFVQGGGEGADNVKMVRTESGAKLPASYRSGRFEEWKTKTRTSLPKVGESELADRGGSSSFTGRGGRDRFRHTKITEGKPLDPKRLGYERKLRQMQKGAKECKEDGAERGGAGKGGKKGAAPLKTKGSRYGGKPIGKVKNELKTVDAIRKARNLKEKRRQKNARPSRKGR